MEIKISNLSKKYDDKYVLKDVSFTFSNEVIGLLGHSGAGKTTLLRILSNLESYNEGSIIIDNKDINDSSKNVCILLQNQELISHLNVFNNISFMLEHIKNKNTNKDLTKQIKKEIKQIKEKNIVYTFKVNKKEKKSLILNLIEKYDIAPYSINLYIKSKGNDSIIEKKINKLNRKISKREERYLTKYEIEKEVITVSKLSLSSSLLFKKPSELSFGENQRVKLALALIKKPSLLLLDEPTGNLDPQLKKEIISNIKNIYSKLKIPIIYVTHSFDEASKVCSKLIFLNHGQIEQYDSVNNIKTNPKTSFIESYLE